MVKGRELGLKEKIISQLKRLEFEENVVILYACESGRRAWGFPSADSDYDVRFLYVHPTHWYLSIEDKRNVIERSLDDRLDMNGWDLTATSHLRDVTVRQIRGADHLMRNQAGEISDEYLDVLVRWLTRVFQRSS